MSLFCFARFLLARSDTSLRCLQRRLWGTTLAEVLIPVIVMLIMVGIREAIPIDNASASTQPINQTSPLSFFSCLCSADLMIGCCHLCVMADLRRDDITNFNASVLSQDIALYPLIPRPTGTIQPIAFIPTATVGPLVQRFVQDVCAFCLLLVLFGRMMNSRVSMCDVVM
jgi:hypothetical protein